MSQILNRSVLLLIFAVIAYNALAFGGVRLIDQAVTLGVIASCLALFAWRCLKETKAPRFELASWCLLAFVVYALGRHHFAEIEYVSRRELLDIGLATATFFLVSNAIGDERDARWLIGALLLLATFLAFYGAYQFFTKSDFVWGSLRPIDYRGRGSGTFINPNHLAGFLEMLLPLGIGCVVLRKISWTVRIVAGYAVIIVIAGIGLTLSRGGWLAAGIGLAIVGSWLVMAHRQSRWWLGLIAMSLLVGTMLLGTSAAMRARVDLTQNEYRYWQGSTRILIWKAAFSEWRLSPWWGAGGDHFQYRFFAHRDEWLQSNPVRVHNDYLNTLCDYGVVGAGAAGFFAMAVFGNGMRALRLKYAAQSNSKQPRVNRQILLVGALSGLASLAVHSLFDFNLHLRANLLLAAVLGGIVLAFGRDPELLGKPGRRQQGAARNALCFLGVLVLVSTAVAFVWQGHRAFIESQWLRRADSSRGANEDAPAMLRAAVAVEPGNPKTMMLLGDYYQQRSLLGGDDYREMAELALEQYRHAIELLPSSPWPLMGCGVCLDWLSRHAEAQDYFDRMIALDPNGKRARAMMGWHYFQVEKFSISREWIQKSLALPHGPDSVASSYDQALRQRGH